jgi:LytS/YehU family sensor histidine kinase
MLYSRFIVVRFLFHKKYSFFIPATILCFAVLLVFLYGIYSLILKFPLSPQELVYFTFNYGTIARESVWIIINMSLATAISFAKEALDEKDLLVALQKDTTFYKLRYLRAQLNPHFLFNTLNSIYSLSLQKSDKAPEVVIRLADIMRYLIYECNEEKIALNKEIEFIRNYIEIEEMRYKADIRFVVEGETNGVMIEPFLFISFIENGFKHALDNSFTEPFIYINLKVGAGLITLNVINSSNADLELQAKRINGKGMSNSKTLLELLYPDAYALDIIQTEKDINRENSLRMHNAKERLESLYPDSYTLDVILKNNTFTVSLIIKTRAA